MPKLSEGDTIALQGEVTLVHDDDRVTVRLHGYGVPVTVRVEHLNIVKKRPEGPASRWATFRTSIRNARSAQGSQPAVTFSRERE